MPPQFRVFEEGKPSLEALYAPIQADLDRAAGLFSEALATDNPFVLDMVRHLGEAQGKQLRAALTLLCFRASGRGAEASTEAYRQALVTAEAVELIHNATLIHDDVIDDSDTRRGRRTLNYRWGNEISVLMGDFLFARVFILLARTVDPSVIRVISTAMDRLCEGEIQEVRARFQVTQNVAEYFEVIDKKTAALISVACEAGGRIGGAGEAEQKALRAFGHKIGLAFQVTDDLLDLTASEARLGKPKGHDLREGKFTLPLLHALSTCSRDQRSEVQETLLKAELQPHDLDFVMGFIASQGGIEHARARAAGLVAEAKGHLAALPEGPAVESLRGLADYILERDH